jgi:hypothetical protein
MSCPVTAKPSGLAPEIRLQRIPIAGMSGLGKARRDVSAGDDMSGDLAENPSVVKRIARAPVEGLWTAVVVIPWM